MIAIGFAMCALLSFGWAAALILLGWLLARCNEQVRHSPHARGLRLRQRILGVAFGFVFLTPWFGVAIDMAFEERACSLGPSRWAVGAVFALMASLAVTWLIERRSSSRR